MIESELDKRAVPGDSKYPIVLTTYSLTEHRRRRRGDEKRALCCKAEPQLYVEMSEELAKEKESRTAMA